MEPPSTWPSVVIHLRHEDPVDLDVLTSALGAFGSEYERHIRRVLPFLDPAQARLVVTDIQKGSTILEMVPALAWIAPFVPDIEKLKATSDFVRNLRDMLAPYFKPDARNPEISNASVNNLYDLAAIVARDTRGSVEIAAKTRENGTLEAFGFRRDEAAIAQANLASERVERERRDEATYPKVLLVFRQTRRGDAAPGKLSGDRGVIESIDLRELKIIYVSEMAGDRIKAEIGSADHNPYHRGFVVDVNVETVGGRPAAYRIMELHEVIDLE